MYGIPLTFRFQCDLEVIRYTCLKMCYHKTFVQSAIQTNGCENVNKPKPNLNLKFSIVKPSAVKQIGKVNRPIV